MKNLSKKIVAVIVLIQGIMQLNTQTFDIDYTNTQVCSGSISVQVYDAFNNPLLPSPVNLPPGLGNCVVGCQAGTPAYVIFTDGSCSITVNVGSGYNCPAAGAPCTCACITSGTSYQVATSATPSCCSSPNLIITIS